MKHDENKVLRSVSRIAKIDYGSKSIKCSKNATIGIHMWGKIDYLTNYCGWYFNLDNSAGVGYNPFATDSTSSARAQKKVKKEPKLTDKTKKVSKHK